MNDTRSTFPLSLAEMALQLFVSGIPEIGDIPLCTRVFHEPLFCKPLHSGTECSTIQSGTIWTRTMFDIHLVTKSDINLQAGTTQYSRKTMQERIICCAESSMSTLYEKIGEPMRPPLRWILVERHDQHKPSNCSGVLLCLLLQLEFADT